MNRIEPNLGLTNLGLEYQEAVMLLQFPVDIYWDQVSRGKFFLHEHPATASSWDLPIIRELAEHPGVSVATVLGVRCLGGTFNIGRFSSDNPGSKVPDASSARHLERTSKMEGSYD